MGKCSKCDQPAICGVGNDNDPVCQEHLDEYLANAARVVNRLESWLHDATAVE